MWLANPTEREPSMEYLRANPGLSAGILLGGAALATAYNLVSVTLIYVTSSTTAGALSVALKVLTIVVAFIWIDHNGTPANYVFMALFCCTLVFYSYIRQQGW